MNKEMDKIFKELAKQMMLQKKIDAEVDRLKDEVKKYMNDNDLKELIGKEHKAKLTEVNQSRIDGKRLREEHPRIAKKYTVDSSYTRFNFT